MYVYGIAIYICICIAGFLKGREKKRREGRDNKVMLNEAARRLYIRYKRDLNSKRKHSKRDNEREKLKP